MEYQIQTEQQFVFICMKVGYENIGEAANGNRVHIGAWTRVKVDNRSSDTETDEPSFITLCLVGFMITKDKSIKTLVSCLQCNSIVVVWGCLVRPECGGGGGGRNHTQMEILRPRSPVNSRPDMRSQLYYNINFGIMLIDSLQVWEVSTMWSRKLSSSVVS